MKKNILVVIGLIASTSSALALERRWEASADLLNRGITETSASPSLRSGQGPGVPGYGFMAMGEQAIKLADCKKVVVSFAELIREPIESLDVFLDYSVFCLPLAEGSLVAYNYVTEPWNREQVPAFEKLMTSLKEKRIGEITVRFHGIQSLVDAQKVDLTENGGKVVYSFPREVAYESFVANYGDIDRENRAFRVPHLYKFLDFLRLLLPAESAKLIEAAMTENHTVTSWHRPMVVLKNGQMLESNVSLGNNRFCASPETPCTR